MNPGRCPGVCALLLAACGTDPVSPPRTWSFERDMDGWTVRALDVGDDAVTAPWSVTRTIEDASNGAWSLKVTVDNRTDAAKVWIERAIDVAPGRTYDVQVSFDFGTHDFGDVNLWRVMGGALADSPTQTDDLIPVFQDDTRSGASGPERRWLPKSYVTTVTAGTSGRIYLVVGVWGTYEVARTYFLDNVGVSVVEIEEEEG